jgi:hypothetical protein
MRATETCAIYLPGSATLADANVVPKAVTLSRSGVAVNIHRNTREAQALAFGVLEGNPALLYCDTADMTAFSTRAVILDGNNVAWLVIGNPSLRTRFRATAHVRCLLQGMNTRPDGLP